MLLGGGAKVGRRGMARVLPSPCLLACSPARPSAHCLPTSSPHQPAPAQPSTPRRTRRALLDRAGLDAQAEPPLLGLGAAVALEAREREERAVVPRGNARLAGGAVAPHHLRERRAGVGGHTGVGQRAQLSGGGACSPGRGACSQGWRRPRGGPAQQAQQAQQAQAPAAPCSTARPRPGGWQAHTLPTPPPRFAHTHTPLPPPAHLLVQVNQPPHVIADDRGLRRAAQQRG